MKVYELMKILETEPAGSQVQVTVVVNDNDYEPNYVDKNNTGYFEGIRNLSVESDEEKTYVEIIGHVND